LFSVDHCKAKVRQPADFFASWQTLFEKLEALSEFYQCPVCNRAVKELTFEVKMNCDQKGNDAFAASRIFTYAIMGGITAMQWRLSMPDRVDNHHKGVLTVVMRNAGSQNRTKS
jgi:hypothetical protein